MPAYLASWLTDAGSLTCKLQKSNQYNFSVQLLKNNWTRPLPDECLSMRVPMTQIAMQREVRLMDGKEANVYARTVIPLSTYQAMRQRFSNLGNNSLSELLFTKALVKRGPIEITCLKLGNELYEMAILGENYRPKELWARRSHFYLSGKILLVNEIFLPIIDWSN
ncbi:MAG: chorismate lyase [Piscirickettsiaceae bacterium]|nr:chorismate lyase [Piscirickettsiaceae bacterium]